MMHRQEIILASVTLGLTFAAMLFPALSQDPASTMPLPIPVPGGVSNTADTLSNLAFVGVGSYGLLLRHGHAFFTMPLVLRFWSRIFFAGLVATGLGSAWYHWSPQDIGLAVDRYGMVIAFAGVLGAIAAHKVSDRAGHGLSWVSLA